MVTQTKESLSSMTPEEALQMLKDGNRRYIAGNRLERNLLQQTAKTAKEQYPFAVVLGCIDSRVPLELVFDQGIGDVFGIRIAGNFVNKDILGSMEFATKISGAKHILVLGHTNCGAIQAAMDGVELGYLTGVVNKLQPAVDAVKKNHEEDILDINEIVKANVCLTTEEITKKSPIIQELVERKELSISGGIYNVATGEVAFL